MRRRAREERDPHPAARLDAAEKGNQQLGNCGDKLKTRVSTRNDN
jgi:hypothetical protein